MLRTLDLQIQDAEYIQLPEQKMSEIQEAKSLKEKMINIRNILKIQQEIKNYGEVVNKLFLPKINQSMKKEREERNKIWT